MFEVENDIPVTPLDPTKKRILYPFKDLDIGQSFFVPFDGHHEDEVRNRVGSAAYKAGKRLGRKFTVRLAGDGFRCWRLDDPVMYLPADAV